MGPKFNSLIAAAREYCSAIETAEEHPDRWLLDISRLLPQLHAALAALGMPETEKAHGMYADLEARFELYSQLHRLLGERDSYWLAYDAMSNGYQPTGSLADDLTDIYCELKYGLAIYDGGAGENESLCNLHEGFRVHWGQHLLDAERHLYELSAKGQLR